MTSSSSSSSDVGDDNHEGSSDNNEDDDDDDDDDGIIDPSSLGDWRAFRMNLANSGLSSPPSPSSAIDGIDLTEMSTTDGGDGDESSASTVSSYSSAVSSSSSSSSGSGSSGGGRPKSVSKRNEALLDSQNAALAEEYLTGAWAHESATPEAGGLVCRMPLEAEIYRGGGGGNENNNDNVLSRRLRSMLESDDDYGGDDAAPTSSLASSANSAGGASRADDATVASSSANSATASTGAVAGRSAEDSAPNDDDDDDNSTFSALAAKTAYWYRGAERLLKDELASIMANADADGRIDADGLPPRSLEVLKLYMDHQNAWQEVCLVIERDERAGTATTITINRPMAFKLSESLGRLVLLGAHHAVEGGGGGSGGPAAVNVHEGDGIETRNVVKFLSAFENECGVYVGGPDDMDMPAVMIHGVEDLPGSVEISPGTGIYRGGIEAAMDGVLSGRYRALDFRFFVGHMRYAGGELDEAVGAGKYQPVACSRPLVLKQCMQLPKPLWHEGTFSLFLYRPLFLSLSLFRATVGNYCILISSHTTTTTTTKILMQYNSQMNCPCVVAIAVLEFCGGELKEISRLELAKRDDLR